MSGLVFIGSLLGAMAIGVPIAFALMLSGIAMMLLMGNLDPNILAQRLVNGADSYPLMAIPFFLIAGELMNAGGLSRRIVNVALALVGHIRGGSVRAIAVAGPTRAAILPDVPSASEAGLPAWDAAAWFGAFVPARTPAPAVAVPGTPRFTG